MKVETSGPGTGAPPLPHRGIHHVEPAKLSPTRIVVDGSTC
ncbi:hypothetical protein [Chondromyces apiculatus]|uniref:Uncharacterized protein n=1 Tax=Chondromyces apiculatus DSM 436 TaxID=1192034 RepID=A0A017TIK4_9BACT|nr:hypothetical protein [Chondromyces apiculatus]EYF08680.1 Hypothetical protein CAP_2541 [Chondromyces apiculatus DSM 436]